MSRKRAWTLASAVAVAAACGGSEKLQPPPTPTNLAATPGDGVAGVRWDAASGADGYTVYWSTASGAGKGGTAIHTQATSLNHSGLTNGVTYHYVVAAVNAAGESPESAEASATPLPSHYPLTISRAGTGGGTVASAPAGIDCGASCAASFATGTSVTLTATPDATSTFDGWSGDCSGTGDCTVALDGARSVTATFTRITHHLTVVRTGTGGGAVTSMPAGIDCGVTCEATFDAGTSVTLTAAPDATSTFAGWSGACTGAGECTVAVDAAASVTATFTRITHGLAVSRAGTGGGKVTTTPAGIDCGATCAASYEVGTVVTLTAIPDATSTFAGWSGACTGTGTCAVTVDAARSVTATFTRVTHALTVARAGTGGGAVASTPAGIDCGATCTATYDATTPVTLTATPDATSTFAGWSGACTGTGPCTVTMNGARSVTATFTRITYGLSVGGTGGGVVASTPAGIDCGASCSATYESGTVVSLTATPDPGATFAGWSGACTGTVPTCSVAMDAAKAVQARFTLPMTVTRAGTGSGTVDSTPAGIACGSSCSASYDAGTTVTLTATANAISSFAGWSGACAGTGPCTVTMSAARNVNATFTLNTYPVTVSRAGSGGGTVTSNLGAISCGATCSATYDGGSSVTLTAAADSTSTFAGWSGDCASAGTSPTCTLTMDAAKSVTATFPKKIYTLSVTRTGGGTVTSAPAGISCGTTCSAGYESGTTLSLTATPDAGATFATWTGCDSITSGTCTVAMNAAKAVSATFTYPLSVSKSGTGGGTVTTTPGGINCGSTCSASYAGGSTVTLTATPDSVSDFSGWSGGVCSGTGTCVVTMDAARSVSATFTRRTYALGVTVAGNGSVQSSPAGIFCVSGTCSAVYVEGTVVTLTASGSGFLGWTGCDSTSATTCTVAMNAAKAVSATFTYNLNVGRTGAGSGTVTSIPAGINCGATCGAGFAPGTVVTLTATPDASSVFTGWLGICSGTGTCVVTMDTSSNLTATFGP